MSIDSIEVQRRIERKAALLSARLNKLTEQHEQAVDHIRQRTEEPTTNLGGVKAPLPNE